MHDEVNVPVALAVRGAGIGFVRRGQKNERRLLKDWASDTARSNRAGHQVRFATRLPNHDGQTDCKADQYSGAQNGSANT